MDMQFTLREEYSDLVGGVINYGPGKSFNIGIDLPKDGQIKTNVPALQQALCGYRGAHGYVFDVVGLKPDGTEITDLFTGREEPPAKLPTRTPAEAVKERAKKEADVIHSLATGYELLSETELMEIIASRDLDVPPGGKPALVQILENADKGV